MHIREGSKREGRERRLGERRGKQTGWEL
jgi:hypothetical protein